MFKENVEAIFASLNNMVSTKTIIGDPIIHGNTTIIPILTASFGFGLGDGEGSEPSRGTGKGSGGGAGAKLAPNSLIIMQGDDVKVYSLSHKGTVEKLAELVPVILSKMKKPGGDA
ncbi:MAG: Sporulation protein YtfJ (Spore_YtfJ) [Pelotomaculum sp. PtaU1.Bin035]|nr:MAG: Sporulation protein YtfJ (Spore_YtfJ) [Pelotomaculum sp. PtaU1.Bin035]